MLSGHRDTHFRFLADLAVGEEVELEGPDGAMQRFVVRATRIVHQAGGVVLADAREPTLILTTCYPFDAVRHGPLRYVLHAVREAPQFSRRTRIAPWGKSAK